MKLEKLIGQDIIIQNVLSCLVKGKIISVNINGVAGSGKSWLLNNLSDQISKYDGCIIKLFGDFVRNKETFYPLNIFLEHKKKISKSGVKAVKELIGEIPIFGASAKSLLEDVDLQSLYNIDIEAESFHLLKHKQFTTHVLSLINNHEILGILCDDIQDFDIDTINYINNLIQYLNTKEFTAKIFFVFAFNTEKNENSNSCNWLSAIHYEYLINRIKRTELPICLTIMGLNNELQESDLSLIYSSSGGHLHILRSIVAYLNKNNINNILTSKNKNLIYNLFDSRLHQFQQYYSSIKQLLCALGGIGKSGSKFELLCLLEGNDDIAGAMKHAEQLDFISIKDGYLYFTHDIVKEYVSSIEGKKNSTFYKKFSNCLRILNPSNYLRRAWAEEMAGEIEKSDIYRALFILQRIRMGLYNETTNLKNLFISSNAEKLANTIEIFLHCYLSNAKSSLNEALSIICQLPPDLPQELLAERIYTECEILLKQVDSLSRKEALNKLESWDFLKEEEPEQWYRFAQLKLLANSELGNYELAFKIEQEIYIYFSKRISFDINAQDILNRLNLFSEIIYSPEIAQIKIKQTYQILHKEIEFENYDKILDYYISLCNLSGNSITINKIDDAITHSQAALTLIKKFPHVHFPHKEIPINNFLLASHFNLNESPETIRNTFNELSEKVLEEDGILVNVNYAGILVQQNMIESAFDVLKSINYLIDLENIDIFYLYHHKFNYALVIYLMGKKKEAIVMLEGLVQYEKQINNKLTSYYKKHFEIILELIHQNNTLTYSNMCKLFESIQPRYLGTSWEKFKHVYLFTDLQIWTNN